jgi:hypothetical protein
VKYFIVQTHKAIEDSLEINGWQEKIHKNFLNPEELYKIPKRIVLKVSIRRFIPFPDLVFFPFLMVTERVYEVIKMYGEITYSRDIILMNSDEQLYKHYYLLVLDNQSREERLYSERNIFWTEVKGKKKLVMSFDLVESILSRGAIGICLSNAEW